MQHRGAASVEVLLALPVPSARPSADTPRGQRLGATRRYPRHGSIDRTVRLAGLGAAAAGAEMEPPQGVAAQSAPLQPHAHNAPQPTPGDNNSSCQDDVNDEPSVESSQDVSPAATPDAADVQYRTFSEVVRASPVPAARQLGADEVGALSSAAADEDEDDTGQVALWPHERPLRGDQGHEDVEVIRIGLPRGPPPSLHEDDLSDVLDDAHRFGGYVAHSLDQDEQEPSSLHVVDEEGSSSSLESAVSELPEDVDGRAHFFSPLKRIVRIYLRRRTVAPETMGNLQVS